MNKIECLGYKISFFNSKMWYYKYVENDIEYCIVDTGSPYLLDMVWKNNDFENGNLDKNKLEELIKDVPKKDFELEKEEGENQFFTKTEIIKEEIVETKKDRTNKIYNEDEVNEILSILEESDYITSYSRKNKKYNKITEDVFEDDYKELIGYKVKCKTDGDHKTDGQMVTYDITFKSPSGKKTHICTDMCLMIGWNYHEDLKIE